MPTRLTLYTEEAAVRKFPTTATINVEVVRTFQRRPTETRCWEMLHLPENSNRDGAFLMRHEDGQVSLMTFTIRGADPLEKEGD